MRPETNRRILLTTGGKSGLRSQRMRNLPDIFGEEAPADAVLIKSYNSIMSEAGLSVPLETSADLAAVQSIQRGPKVV